MNNNPIEMKPIYFFNTIFKSLSIKRKKQIIFLLILMLFTGLSEMISLFSIVPFLTFASGNLDQTIKIPFWNIFSKFLPPDQLVFFTGIIFIILLLLTLFLRLSTLYLNAKITSKIVCDISSKAYEKSLFQNYEYHLNTNTSEIFALLTNKCDCIVSGFNSVFQIIVSLIITIFISTTLIIINWEVSLFALLVSCGSYLIITLFTKKALSSNSRIIDLSLNKKYKNLQEGLGSIKEILLTSNQFKYINTFNKIEKPLRNSLAENDVLRVFPRYLLEFILISFMTGFSLIIFNSSEDNLNKVIPLLGTFALGTQKLLPVLQVIYSNWSNLKGKSASILKVLNYIEMKKTLLTSKKKKDISVSKVNFREISFKSVFYKYLNKKVWALENLSFKIKQGEKIGIVGKTGSGKSTFINLLIGLLTPTKGIIKINSNDIYKELSHETLTNWRNTISYVPQEIYLTDASIAENVAFGEELHEINLTKLKDSLEKAKILDLVNSLPEGYKTKVGDRGIQLSGGQRQRIGIARALYKKTKIIILDEATSALDSRTEEEILKCFMNFKVEITLIMIAHRTSSLKICDRVFEIQSGKIKNIYQNQEFFSPN